MKTLNLLTYASILAKQEVGAVISTHKELIDALSEHFNVNVLMHQDINELPNEGLNIVFIATGGTEGMVVRDYRRLPHPLYLLTDGKANSLAASLELRSRIESEGNECHVIHGTVDSIVRQLTEGDISIVGNSFVGSCDILKDARIGVIGHASDWLVASCVDYTEAQRRWGVKYVDIPLSLVEEYYAKTTDQDAKHIAEDFSQKSLSCKEPDAKEILKASRLYLAIRHVAQLYRLDALTLQCFSLISTTCTTGCLALALLNDEGVVAGCEGDMQSIFTMLLVKRLTGKDCFMANPALIDVEKDEVTFAHCTIGLKQTDNYIIRSHFESQSGVAIQGLLPTGDVTIVKVGGDKLNRFAVMEGTIVANEDDPRKCRTQIRIQLDSATSSAQHMLQHTIGNHHIIVSGRWTDEIRYIQNHQLAAQQ